MKKLILLWITGAAIALTMTSSSRVSAAIDPVTIIRAFTIKVIRAIDLKIQRLQNQTIWLQNAQKLLENKLSKLKLKEIADWTQKQREQYQQYYDELGKVKLAISHYQRIKEVVQKQARLNSEYRQTWSLLKRDGHFKPEELDYMNKVYSGILKQSGENLEQVYRAVSSFSFKMSDAERLEIINDAADRLEKNYDDLKTFNRQNIMLSLNRAKSQQDIDAVKKFYGLK